jgi:hypothetical protein
MKLVAELDAVSDRLRKVAVPGRQKVRLTCLFSYICSITSVANTREQALEAELARINLEFLHVGATAATASATDSAVASPPATNAAASGPAGADAPPPATGALSNTDPERRYRFYVPLFSSAANHQVAYVSVLLLSLFVSTLFFTWSVLPNT